MLLCAASGVAASSRAARSKAHTGGATSRPSEQADLRDRREAPAMVPGGPVLPQAVVVLGRCRSPCWSASRSPGGGAASRSMSRSRTVLAMTAAAAMDWQSASPSTSASWGKPTSGSGRPSIRMRWGRPASGGRRRSRARARCMASAVATRMLSRSISSRDAAPTAEAERAGPDPLRERPAHARRGASCCPAARARRGSRGERRRPRPPPVLPVGRGPLHRRPRGAARGPRPPVPDQRGTEAASLSSRASPGCAPPCRSARAGSTAWRGARGRGGPARPRRWWGCGSGTCARRRRRPTPCGR